MKIFFVRFDGLEYIAWGIWIFVELGSTLLDSEFNIFTFIDIIGAK